MAVRRPCGGFLVAGKSFYPPGTLRLLTGRMKPGESPWDALARELYEETGFTSDGAELIGTVEHTLGDSESELVFCSCVFVIPERAGQPHPMDDDEQLTEFQDASVDDLRRIVQRLRILPGKWADWGRFRAEVIQALVEMIAANSL